jgi:hypothetical protein
MDSKPERPLRLFVNPFAIWTDLALKAGQAMWSSYAAAARETPAPNTPAPNIAVIPTAEAPTPVSHRAAKAARAKVRHKTKAKAKAKRRARR